MHDRSSAAIARAEWQPTLFGTVGRAELLALEPVWPCRPLRIAVHRNHGFESVASAARPYGAWNRIACEFSIGPYDDSLAGVPEGADVELIWLDADRYPTLAPEALGEWLVDRVRALRAASASPIVVAAWPCAAAARAVIELARPPGVFVADLDALAVELGPKWLDLRTARLSGTRLGNAACVRVARELACRWLPAAVLPPVKAIVVDLDGTLHAGVLGEDGIDGIRVTEGHRFLQEALGDYARRGVFLALVSRNEREDVEQLFARHPGFSLALADFAAVEVSWDEKADAIERIARHLRIGADSMVFVDDNPGELAAVAARLPVATVHARADAKETATALANVAGLWRWHGAAEDSLRLRDLQASAERDALAAAAPTPGEYLRSLGVRLAYFRNAREHLARIADLVQKTNQFNLALRRMNEAEIAARMGATGAGVVAFGLNDRLSDSGIVGALVGEREGDALRVEEVCVSCRALGRHLEDSMLTQALKLLADGDPPRRVVFDVRTGPRNRPAREWLERYLGTPLAEQATEIAVPYDVVRRKTIDDAIAIEVVQ